MLERILGKVKPILNQGQDFLYATLGAIASYNLAGLICDKTNISDNPAGTIVTSALLAAGTILGYKSRKIIKNIRRAKARNKCLEEMAKPENEEFLKRQGIQKGESGKIRKGLRYLLTVPAGGALGYFQGSIGIIPLCIHFGKYYSSDFAEHSLNAGRYAGAAIGAYAFVEMTAKKQYERLATTASALAGASISPWIINALNLQMLNSYKELYTGLGIAVGSAVVAGTAGNLIFRGIKRKNQKTKLIPTHQKR